MYLDIAFWYSCDIDYQLSIRLSDISYQFFMLHGINVMTYCPIDSDGTISVYLIDPDRFYWEFVARKSQFYIFVVKNFNANGDSRSC